jgi:hypothetical protein
MLLSPNGRILTLTNGPAGVVFIDIETGNKIWELSDASRVAAWLPEIGGFICLSRDGVLKLADTEVGTIQPHPLGLRQTSWGTRISRSPSRTLIAD